MTQAAPSDQRFGVVAQSATHSYTVAHRLSATTAATRLQICQTYADNPSDYAFAVWNHADIVAAGLLLCLLTSEVIQAAQTQPVSLAPGVELQLGARDLPTTRWEARMQVDGVAVGPAAWYTLPAQLAALEQAITRTVHMVRARHALRTGVERITIPGYDALRAAR